MDFLDIVKEINLIYYVENDSICRLFGGNFVNNNKKNIELKISGKNIKLINKYELKEGEDIITLLVKNKLTNLIYMYDDCNNLKDNNELKYLNVNEVKNFRSIFIRFSSLANIKPLQNWLLVIRLIIKIL